MFLEKSFKLKLWSEWDDEVAAATEEFTKEYVFSPNGLVANSWTFSQIDFITTISEMREHTFRYNPKTKQYDVPYDKDETVEVSSFACPDGKFDMLFYFDKELKDKEYKLFFSDEEDDDDDESETPVPIDNPVLVEVF